MKLRKNMKKMALRNEDPFNEYAQDEEDKSIGSGSVKDKSNTPADIELKER